MNYSVPVRKRRRSPGPRSELPKRVRYRLSAKSSCAVSDELDDKFGSPQSASGKNSRREPLAAKEGSGALQDDKRDPDKPLSNSNPQQVLLPDAVPAVLQWVRDMMDLYSASSTSERGLSPSAQNSSVTPKELREHVRLQIRSTPFLSIKLTGKKTLWRGSSRFWENVCSVAIKLPPAGGARCIFEAMKRYPSSRLMHNDLSLLFGRERQSEESFRMKNGWKLLSLFDHYGRTKNRCNRWFDGLTYGRLQEMSVHLTAVTEYIMRCAYFATDPTDGKTARASRFFTYMKDCVVYQKESGRITLTKPPSTYIPGDMSENAARRCLESSLSIAHDAVVNGTRLMGLRHRQNNTKSPNRCLIQLPLLQRMPADVLDQLVRGLWDAVREVMEEDMDWDKFASKIVDILRDVNRVFEDIYLHFHASSARGGDPMRLEDGCQSPDVPYTFIDLRG